MKTKFILHGGFAPNKKQEDNAFFKEILKSAPKKANVLLVYFAKEIDRTPASKKEDIAQFNKNKDKRTLQFDVANEKYFLKQVEWADVVYLRGGTTLKLLDTLKKFPDLKQSFNGKIIVGDSAGANVLSTIFYSERSGGVLNGLGFVPVKIACHYSEKYKEKVNELNKYSDDLEILLLPEYQYRVSK